jgi:hypothetical protein
MTNSSGESTPAPVTHPSDNPTSEVGYGPVISMQEHLAILRELIQLRAQVSRVEPRNLSLPRFDPDAVGADPAAWCSAATLMLQENPLRGSELFSVLSRAVEGSAAHWLTQVLTNRDVTWPALRELFITRFGGKEIRSLDANEGVRGTTTEERVSGGFWQSSPFPSKDEVARPNQH